MFLPGRARVGRRRRCAPGRKGPGALGQARKGILVFWGTNAKGSPERETWPFLCPVLILSTPQPLSGSTLVVSRQGSGTLGAPATLVMTRSFQPGEAAFSGHPHPPGCSAPIPVTWAIPQQEWDRRVSLSPSHPDVQTDPLLHLRPGSSLQLTVHQGWCCLMAQPRAPEAHRPHSDPSFSIAWLCDPGQLAEAL